jgi:O-methyltransferase involved in polyketide biosynthesis
MTDAEAPDRPFVAGMYDYYLGGTANTEADRAAVERVRQFIPEIGDVAWANRGFLQRAVKRMAADWGIRQYVDIGAGLPTQRNTHEVVRESIPQGRVVYVDIDERVIERGRTLLAGQDGVAVIQADMREPEKILAHPEVVRLIDFDQPVGLLFVAVIQFIPAAEDPWGLVKRYVDAVAPGSYLAVSAPTADHQATRITEGVRQVYAQTPSPGQMLTREEVSRFFDGLEIVPPYEGAGPVVTYVGEWGAEDPEAADDDSSRWVYAAVGRKP